MVTSGPPDPVRARRRRIGAAAATAKRIGYLLFGVAVVAFAAGAIADFPPALVTVVVAAMVVGSILLAPAIVVAYGVQKAEREDPQR